jgi:hypothetical protein
MLFTFGKVLCAYICTGFEGNIGERYWGFQNIGPKTGSVWWHEEIELAIRVCIWCEDVGIPGILESFVYLLDFMFSTFQPVLTVQV